MAKQQVVFRHEGRYLDGFIRSEDRAVVVARTATEVYVTDLSGNVFRVSAASVEVVK